MNSKKDATSTVPNVDTLFSRKKTTTKKSTAVAKPPTTAVTVKSVTPPKKKKTTTKKPTSPPKVEVEKKKTPKKVVTPPPPPVPEPPANIQENKSIGVDNINSILDSLENISIMDIISSTENPDMTTMFNNLLAIS